MSAAPDFLVITGMSGAGRSTAADVLEDLGWDVIDNLPARLIPMVAEGEPSAQVCLVIGRSLEEDDLDELERGIAKLRAMASRVRVVFLDAADETLIRRFEGTRRRHPLRGDGVAESITRERSLLAPIRGLGDVVVDTTRLNVNQLRERLVSLFGADIPEAGMRTAVVSFGYSHGIPLDVDIVLDCRFLPNPFWEDDLRALAGTDAPVREYVLRQSETVEFLAKLDDMLGMLLPAFVKEGKSYLTIAVGCTGGRHRSVVLAEEVASAMNRHGYSPTVTHRDVER